MSCRESWWMPENAQVVFADLKNDDGTPATGLDLTAYLMAEEDGNVGEAIASQAMTEGDTVTGYRRYRTVFSAATIDTQLNDGDEAFVVVIGTNIRRTIEQVKYSYSNPALSVP